MKKENYHRFVISYLDHLGIETNLGWTTPKGFTQISLQLIRDVPEIQEIRFRKVQYDHELEGRKRLE